MSVWLQAHVAQLHAASWIVVFAVIAGWESFRPRRRLAVGYGHRWINNATLTGAGYLLSRLCVPLTGFSLALLAERNGWGLLNLLGVPPWLGFVLGVLFIDLAGYGLHRLLHASSLLWRCHKIHHADLDVDCTTAICHHPAEFLLVGGVELAVIGLIGVPSSAVVAAATLGSLVSLFNHGNVAIPVGVDRMLRRFVVTPDMHRLHHSLDFEESNRNFTVLFPWWDALFSTYRERSRLPQESMPLGITDARLAEDVTLWKLSLLPFRRA